MALWTVRCFALHFERVLPAAQYFTAMSTGKAARMKLDVLGDQAWTHDRFCTGPTEGLVGLVVAHFAKWPSIFLEKGTIDKRSCAALSTLFQWI